MAIGQAGQKFKFSWKLAFFVAACLTTAAGVLSILSFVLSFTFDPLNIVNQVFLLAFGLVMMILDIPPVGNDKVLKVLGTARRRIYENFLFMTRFIGRGVWYLFLGTMVCMSLWELDVSPFLGFFFTAYIVILACVSIGFSVILSKKLDRIRMQFVNAKPHVPPMGFTKPIFQNACKEKAGVELTDEDWVYIHNAVEFRPLGHLGDGTDGNKGDAEEKISQESYEAWLRGGMVLV